MERFRDNILWCGPVCDNGIGGGNRWRALIFVVSGQIWFAIIHLITIDVNPKAPIDPRSRDP